MDETFSFQPLGLKSELYFDKIIIYHSIHLFSELNTMLLRFMSALTARGRLLIIHRPIRLNTLPFPADLVDQLRSVDLPLERLISTIQSLRLAFRWEVEDARIVTSKQKWLDMIQHGGFPLHEQREETQAIINQDKTSCSSTTRSDGIHELMTGVLRYAGDGDIEFVDRIVFLTVNRTSTVTTGHNPATTSRCQKANFCGPLEMEVSSEIEDLLYAKNQSHQKKWSLFD